ncbi:MAG: glutathione S-transferase family protein [Polyangiaceae bacterium]
MRLITIGFSHYCEKARWALDRMGVEYTEDSHAPLAHYPAAWRASGQRTVPVLVTEDGVFADSTDILKYVDPFLPEAARLFPEEDNARREVSDLEQLVDREIGPRVRRWVYSWLLDEPAIVNPLVERAMTRAERRMSSVLMPIVIAGIKRGLKISPDLRESQFEKIKATFLSLAPRLAGKKYLAGDSFSAADLTLAALCAPALGVENHPILHPDPDSLPARMREQAEELRATPVGAHVLELYRSERKKTYPRASLTRGRQEQP